MSEREYEALRSALASTRMEGFDVTEQTEKDCVRLMRGEVSVEEYIVDVLSAKARQRSAVDSLNEAMLKFSDIIDGRGDEAFGVDLDEDFDEG